MTDAGGNLTDRKNLRLTFVETLSHQIDNEQAIARLLKYLHEGEEEVRLEVVRILSMTATPAVVGALAGLLDDANPAIREQALKSLVRIFPAEIFTHLEKGTRDPSEWVRLVAVKYLPQCYRQKVNVRELILARLADANPDVAAQAVDSLSRLGDRTVVKTLFETMRTVRHAKVQARIIEALARLKCADLIEVLHQRLWASAALPLRIALVRALGMLKQENEKFLDALLEMLRHEDPFVRANAITAVANPKLAVCERLIAMLRDRHELVVKAAQEALLTLAPQAPPLAALLTKALEEANRSRHQAVARESETHFAPATASPAELKQLDELARVLARLLDQLGNPSLGALLVRIVKNPVKVHLDRLLAVIENQAQENREVALRAVRDACALPQTWMRYQLATVLNQHLARAGGGNGEQAYRLNLIEVLARLKARTALPVLIEMIEREEEAVQVALIHALGEIGGEGILRPLKKFLDHREWLVRVNVALALGKLGTREVFPLLQALAADAHPWVRFNAVEAVRRLTEPDPAEFFADKLLDPDEKVRATAVMGLGLRARPEHYEALGRMLNDRDDRVRANAIEALAFLLGKGVNEYQLKQALLSLLEDPNHRVRANAALALYPLAKDEVLRVLKRMLASPEKWDRAAAVFTLGEIGDLTAAGLLVEMLYDEDSRVRMNTVKALAKVRGDEINRMIVDSIAVVEEKVLQAVNDSLLAEIPDEAERRACRREISFEPRPVEPPAPAPETAG